MEDIIKIISDFGPYIMIGLMALVLLLIILVIVLFRALNKLESKYRRVTRGVNNKNLEEVIVEYLNKVEESKKISEDIKSLYGDMDLRIKECIQKVSVIRYKAFEDVGSDLSFSLAMLDENNDGILLTGIFGRNESTTYAKAIEKGISRYDLSEEEEEALNNAINK